MIDERWDPDVAEVGDALRTLLDAECDEAAVRRAEAADDGRDHDLERTLAAFGVADLPPDAELLARVALELGRALAPVPFVDTATARAVLGVSDTAYSSGASAPLGPAFAAIASDGGVLQVAVEGAPSRTGAGDVVVDLVANGDGRVIGSVADADRMARLVRLLAASRLVGGSRRMHDLGVAYAKERHAFGRPIGEYQAVSHKLVDVAVALEGSELLVRKSAWVAASPQGGDGAPPWLFARLVLANAVESARLTARLVHQTMGGFGATLEAPAQLCSRRVRNWALRHGRPNEELAAVAKELLDPARRDDVRHLWNHDEGMPLPRWAKELDHLP